MKKCCLLLILCLLLPVFAGADSLSVQTNAAGFSASPLLFGLFLEDINFAVDGLRYGDSELGSVAVKDGGKTVAQGTFRPGEPCTVKMPAGFGLWSPESPKLYDFTATFGKDKVDGYFGMRKFNVGKDENGGKCIGR